MPQKTFVTYLLCLFLLGTQRSAVAEPITPDRASTEQKSLSVDERNECRRDSFLLHSDTLDRDVRVRVVLPPSYDEDAERAYPVLYCLHGANAPYETFSEMAGLLRTLKDHPVILAMFDGGRTSLYLDASGDGKADKARLLREPKESGTLNASGWLKAQQNWSAIPDRIPSRYTSFFFQDLVPSLDRLYRIDKHNRAVTGFSMGGFGAMHLMLKKPAFFQSVSGLSTAFYTRRILAAGSDRRLRTVHSLLGEYSESSHVHRVLFHAERAQAILASGKSLPPIYQHCGKEDWLMPLNDEVVDALRQLGCSVDYVTTAGQHNWEFWDGAAPAMLKFHWQHFVR